MWCNWAHFQDTTTLEWANCGTFLHVRIDFLITYDTLSMKVAMEQCMFFWNI